MIAVMVLAAKSNDGCLVMVAVMVLVAMPNRLRFKLRIRNKSHRLTQ